MHLYNPSQTHTFLHISVCLKLSILQADGFCKLGCQLFYAEVPKLTTCNRLCTYFYRYSITTNYSDIMEEAQLECKDGCDIALQICSPGLFHMDFSAFVHCNLIDRIKSIHSIQFLRSIHLGYYCASGDMLPCPIGTFRGTVPDVSLESLARTQTCELCPVGRFRGTPKAKTAGSAYSVYSMHHRVIYYILIY